MMVMMLPRVELVPVNAIPKVTTSNQVDFFQSGYTAVDSDGITHIFWKPLVQFIDRERAVFPGEQRENFPARSSDAVPQVTEFLQRVLQILVTATPVGMGAIVVGHWWTVPKSVFQPKPETRGGPFPTPLNHAAPCAATLNWIVFCDARLANPDLPVQPSAGGARHAVFRTDGGQNSSELQGPLGR
jgi:hypothetical protein